MVCSSSASQTVALKRCRSWVLCLFFFLMVTIISMVADGEPVSPPQRVLLKTYSKHVEIDNGIVKLTLSRPDGMVTGISYKGLDNLLEVRNREINRGYWDIVWNVPKRKGNIEIIRGREYRVIREDDEQVEVSFSRKWNSSTPHGNDDLVPLNIDKRFVVLRGSSGFYTYAVYDRPRGWPAFELVQTRIAFKLRKSRFGYMVVDGTRQHVMPEEKDRRRADQLEFKEAVLLSNATNNHEDKGRVDDKYQYSTENEDNRVHGWISFDDRIGFWQITPSDEFKVGGPLKQELTSHAGPTTLAMFHSTHYCGDDLQSTFGEGEPWKKVYGPVFVYLNSVESGTGVPQLWVDAKRQMEHQVRSWPYSFPASVDYPPAHQRGSVRGGLLVRDRYFKEGTSFPAASAYVGLASPGEVGSWQTETKGYQFWTRVKANGSFSINNVRSGVYNLYAFVPGFIGDYKYSELIRITPGKDIVLGDLVYEPPRDGPTLWEIGIPDRSAREFHIPDPNPKFFNGFLANPKNRFRQYGLWERYAELFPQNDLIYTVGLSDYRKDWFFAHVTRKIIGEENGYKSTTWQIRFHVRSIRSGMYKLRVAIASAQLSRFLIHVNDPRRTVFRSGFIGRDNAIARHGVHGLYWLYSIEVQSRWLRPGWNIIFLTQTKSSSPFQGIMYDYIRLEEPPLL
ncbi:hypothetical protein H6P81_020291 [Aristolochia fimbriata]|uniref:rhamnogalacturonan endolyase n=1 Tax=Aristolochia fimbriata TaxID=158543 RepID=A0AAV7DX98_ARIFI|nr:hypothetical protein H6P81_020291 [Aristolochia fimbriata]